MLDVRLQPLDLHTLDPFGISRWTRSTFENYTVELREGASAGWGEAAPNRRYAESREEGMRILAERAPDIADLRGPAAVEEWATSLAGEAGAGLPGLRAGLSAAAWDMAGRDAGEPVWKLLGLARPAVRTSYTIAIGEPADMLRQGRAAVDRGMGILKVKLGFEGDLGLAERLVRELPGVTFRFDANEGWERERAAVSLERLAALGAELCEQPLPAARVEDQAWLAERSPVPLYADEALLGLSDLDEVAKLYSGVVVKLQKCGGIANAFALISACTQLGLRTLIGCMIESSLGISAGLQLAGLCDHADLDGGLLLADDPFTGIQVEGDLLTAPEGPGLGAERTPTG
jgi:L-alanine-DL-glutamate epimerase-like enolase superfamily enzyme